ncbi:MAG: hypothetical protein AAFP03_03690 [Cyanobacteria bacterium J06598_3]
MPPSTPPPKPPRKPPESQTAADLFPTDSDASAPYWPTHLIDIFIDPGRFFSSKTALGNLFYLAIAVLIAGLSESISYVDQLLLETEIGGAQNSWEDLAPMLQSWPTFWVTSLLGSVLTGALIWVVGGWFFRLRIRLSGAPKPDPRLARIAFVYSLLVRSLPHLLLVVFWTFAYSKGYGDAFGQNMGLSLLLTSGFAFGELFSAYTSVVTLFAVERDRARLWFIIAPAVFYAFSLALVISAVKTATA